MNDDACSENPPFSERAYDAIHRVVDKAAYSMNFVLAALMVLMAAYHIHGIISGDTDIKITRLVGNAVMLVCGLLIVFDKKRDLPHSVGLFAIGMGLYRALFVIGYLQPHQKLNLICYVIMALGLNMAFSGRAYLMGSSRARKMMMMSASAFLLMSIIFIVYLYSGTHDITAVLRDNANTAILGLMYFAFILVLDSESLRRLDWLAVHNRTVDGIRRTYHLSNDAVMLASDAEKLAGGMASADGWMTPSDGGPVSRELRFDILNGEGMTSVVAQIWSGCKDIHLTMTDHPDGTVIQASRIRICDIMLDDACITMTGTDGTAIRVGLTEEWR